LRHLSHFRGPAQSARLAGTVEVIAGPAAVDFNDDPQ
jgi:hypothetical protein